MSGCCALDNRGAKGRFGGCMVAIVDLGARKRAEHKNELLLREISHRFSTNSPWCRQSSVKPSVAGSPLKSSLSKTTCAA